MNDFLLYSESVLELPMQVGKLLLSKGLTMGTAESCTGGRIASLLTAIPGSSAYFMGSVVAYDNRVKQSLLGVSEETLAHWGAVSEAVVKQMVHGVMSVLSCDCAIATSGIAGPDGGTVEKPIGTVWIAVALGKEVQTARCHFIGSRQQVIEQSSEKSLSMLFALLEKTL